MPWWSVGPGWFLVSVDSPARHLLLVDPDGRHFPVFDVSSHSWQVVGWSGDGQRVLLQADTRRFPAATEVVDLRTGRMWRPILPHGVGVVGFTRPLGLGLLTAVVSKQEDGSDTHYRVERRSLYGADPVVLSRDVVPDMYAQHLVYTPDGAHVVTTIAGQLSLVSNATGAVVRTLGPAQMCSSPVRMWDVTHVLALCSTGLYLQPLDGGSPAPLVSPDTRHGPDDVDINVFRTSGGGLYTDSLGACGYEFVGRVGRNYRVHETKIPNVTQNSKPLAVRGSTVAVEAVLGCEEPQKPQAPSLFWWDPKTGHEQVIWAPKQGDQDADFIPFQSPYAAPLQAWLP